MARHYPDVGDYRKDVIADEVGSFFAEYRDYKGQFTDWDGNGDTYCLDDEVQEHLDRLRPRDEECNDCPKSLFNQVICCVRAGFDVAVKPSGGVFGFTAGDVRQFWDGKAPDWVKAFWDEFDEIPDGEFVWL
jgi:hypothetical protein